ncbi:MAG: hypothetical protein ACPGYF_06140 [Chitinophagales bacterium]
MRSYLLLTLLLALGLLWSCKPDDNILESDVQSLQFSADTLTFDTVFTTVGSVTRWITVYNPTNRDMLLDEIRLVDQANGAFRLNIDGLPGNQVSNVLIPSKDSIYIFAEVTVDPNNTSNPLVIYDQIDCRIGTTIRSATLQAWGQDAYFHYGEVLRNQTITWASDKPHVILRNDSFPGLGIDSFSSLTIPPGSEIYVQNGAGIFVDGDLTIGDASSQDSVIIQSNRIENPPAFPLDDLPGQWFGIVLFGGSTANIEHTIINESSYGIMGRFALANDFSGFTDDAGRPLINLNRVTVKNAQISALLALNSTINAVNCEFFSAGGQLISLAIGGDYTFSHCTMYNSGISGSSRDAPLLGISNQASNQGTGAVHPSGIENAQFTNCIINGSLQDEVEIIADDSSTIQLSHCLVRSQELVNSSITNQCFLNENPGFLDPGLRNFKLTETSIARNAGENLGILVDRGNQTRDGMPDIGCWEYQ